jgi:hypothetical protein
MRSMTASTHIRSGNIAHTKLLILEDKGPRKWDPSSCDGVLQPPGTTITTRLDPAGLIRSTRN